MLDKDVLDILERRIERLERQVYEAPLSPEEKELSVNESTSVTELLVQANVMIFSALSRRDSITEILKHLTTINDYLDPTIGESDLEVEAKKQYLIESYPQFKSNLESLKKFEKQSSVADSENIPIALELSNKLDKLVVESLGTQDRNRNITRAVLSYLQKYSDIIGTIKHLFAQLEFAVTELETAVQPKRNIEE